MSQNIKILGIVPVQLMNLHTYPTPLDCKLTIYYPIATHQHRMWPRKPLCTQTSLRQQDHKLLFYYYYKLWRFRLLTSPPSKSAQSMSAASEQQQAATEVVDASKTKGTGSSH
jgi:hypothetical protein